MARFQLESLTSERLNMEKPVKKAVHIAWEEAYRAEAEREKARQMRCVSISPTQSEVIAGKIVTRLSIIKTSAQRLSRDMFKQRIEISSGTRTNYDSIKLAIAITVGIILLVGVGVVSYSKKRESDLARLEGKWKTMTQRSQDSNPEPKVMPEVSKRHFVDPSSTSKNYKSAEADGWENSSDTPAFSDNFEVVDNSFVRDQPEPDATIIATLRPGTQVRVESKTGEYLRVRSLSDADVIGYVHEEDAFFQAR
jgi:hypothetical protein